MAEHEWSEEFRLLRAEASSLVKTIPGTVSSVVLRAGDRSVEISWAAQEPATTGQQQPAPPAREEESADPSLRSVVAPLVGTFYVAPEPGAEPFTRPGARVEPGQTVAIVEAMKLMNQVASEWSGEVVEVLVSDGQPVEFGQELVRVRVEGA
ncbi:acetyl-CoA carboxylase biotin carboxyl carrier protein [Nonomuraea gerenzanensis]|uniref:Biotin carboxyl carrier protein of acetyl-CoA carboxylase n=1 Tax=Nonomuraea gerenzanensis TaxID=93944 RepID=A0A1M4EKP1_9ACTN|nr:acetyl-CoA carboxylase biotin carboxyl carrier protein [Nonomuraea gerenzanensis]UBU10957.1 acetyl-CoA carboxylase biotin carboxyl carrier protein [Nonomuraea gerenzanensis]SBO99406.1 Biotin carboxyl carrier protein of acetyl-CoA carboxylase [Nonomuraea gerenzanensis]